jgi:hypothetical protein
MKKLKTPQLGEKNGSDTVDACTGNVIILFSYHVHINILYNISQCVSTSIHSHKRYSKDLLNIFMTIR